MMVKMYSDPSLILIHRLHLTTDSQFKRFFFPIDRALSFMLDLTISKKADETSHINHRFLTLKIPDYEYDNAIRKK